MQIVWTNEAYKTFENIIDYLIINWTKKELQKFQNKLTLLLKQLSKFSQLCPMSKIIPYRKCVLTSHSSLIYKIENNTLILITFLPNRSLHNF